MDALQLTETWQVNNRNNLYLLDAFVGYRRAQDAHHRSQIIIAMHPLDKKVLYGIWEWGSR